MLSDLGSVQILELVSNLFLSLISANVKISFCEDWDALSLQTDSFLSPILCFTKAEFRKFCWPFSILSSRTPSP